MTSLHELQQVLLDALRHEDPAAALRARIADASAALGARERAWLEDLAARQGDGLRLTRMLIRKLRLQRILRADPDAQAELGRDPEGFAAAFAAYDRDIEPCAVFPRQEAAAFREHRARR